MWIYIREDVGGDINIQSFETFEQAFQAASKEMKRDFSCNYVYREDKIKDLLRKYKSISYNFGWYHSKVHIITDKDPDRIYPHRFDIMKDY